ncbi:MAG: HNH endonuclease signature motif containing protein [Candidatus Omnitrophota bacterium]|nr:HNH endonuclease signature motif containing protein [Candidatus Omnitrophota bacterium]
MSKKPKPKKSIPLWLRERIAIRDKFTCRVCGKKGFKGYIRGFYGARFVMAYERVAKPWRLSYWDDPDNHLIPFEIDHIIPESKGGKMTESNLRLVCRYCNRAKRDRS